MKKRTTLTATLTVLCWTIIIATTAAEEPSPAPEGTFSIVMLPDTQGYVTEKTALYFESEIKWILDNRETQNIVFVSHVGDIVGDYKSDAHWAVARKNMLQLSDKLPFGFSVGNHDMTLNGDSQKFQDAFPTSLFEKYVWYGGQIKNNANSFQLISAGEMDFVILHLECNAPDDVLKWADKVLEEHAERRAMITTHMYLGPRDRPQKPRDYFDAPKGRMRWHKTHGNKGNTPQQIWDKCFSKHRNLFLVCCGDQGRTQTMHRTVEGKQGNQVYETLCDYRAGYLRIFRFQPQENKISAMTYSPYLKQLCEKTSIVAEAGEHQFVLDYEMKK